MFNVGKCHFVGKFHRYFVSGKHFLRKGHRQQIAVVALCAEGARNVVNLDVIEGNVAVAFTTWVSRGAVGVGYNGFRALAVGVGVDVEHDFCKRIVCAVGNFRQLRRRQRVRFGVVGHHDFVVVAVLFRLLHFVRGACRKHRQRNSQHD